MKERLSGTAQMAVQTLHVHEEAKHIPAGFPEPGRQEPSDGRWSAIR